MDVEIVVESSGRAGLAKLSRDIQQTSAGQGTSRWHHYGDRTGDPNDEKTL